MGKYAKKAKHHADKIRHYYEHAGAMGHEQAKYNYNELSNLIGRAFRSKNDKSDVVLIQSLIESVRPLMEEMKRREQEDKQRWEDPEAQQ